jgi:hypothetical protein
MDGNGSCGIVMAICSLLKSPDFGRGFLIVF